MPKGKLSGTIQLCLTRVKHLYRRRGQTEVDAAIAARREPYGAVIAVLPALEPDVITAFAIQHVEPGSTIITSSDPRFDGLVAAGFTHIKDPSDPRLMPQFVDDLAKNLDECMEKAHHAQVSEQNLPEYFAEFSFRYALDYKSVGRRFYALLQTILK